MNLTRQEAWEIIIRHLNKEQDEQSIKDNFKDWDTIIVNDAFCQDLLFANELYRNIVYFNNNNQEFMDPFFLDYIKQAVLNNGSTNFSQIPEDYRHQFINFYDIILHLINYLVEVTFDDLNIPDRNLEISRHVKLFDITSIIQKYDYYFYRRCQTISFDNLIVVSATPLLKDFFTTVMEDNTINIINSNNGNIEKIIQVNNKILSFITIENKIIVLSPQDIEIWDFSTETLEFTQRTPKRFFRDMISLNNNTIVTGLINGTLILWDLNGKSFILRDKGTRILKIFKMKYKGTDHIIILTSELNLEMWNMEKKIAEHKVKDIFLDVALLPDNRIAIDFLDGSLNIWDIEQKTFISDKIIGADEFFESEPSQIGEMIVYKSKLIFGLNDGQVKIYNPDTQKIEHIYQEHKYSIMSMILLPNNQLLISSNLKLSLLDPDTWKLVDFISSGPYDIYYPLTLLPNKKVISATDGNILRIWR